MNLSSMHFEGSSFYKSERSDQNILKFQDFASFNNAYANGLNIQKDAIVAKVGQTCVIRVGKSDLIVIDNFTDAKDVIYMIDPAHDKITHTVSSKLAEFHGWLEISNLQTGKVVDVGVGVRPFGSIFDAEMFWRDDAEYDKKYFVGHKEIDSSSIGPANDKASACVEFYVTHSQYEQLKQSMIEEEAKFHDINTKFDLLKNNCHMAKYDIFSKMLNTKDMHWLDFINSDKLDLADKGMLFEFMSATSMNNALFGKADVLAHYINSMLDSNYLAYLTGEELAENPSVSYLTSCMNFKKETPLHMAIKYAEFNPDKYLPYLNKYIDLALANNISLASIQNNKGESILHYLANLHSSAGRDAAIEKIAKHVSSVDLLDSYGDSTPLTYAIKNNDVATFKLLVKLGADVSFVNARYDNYAHIAASYDAKDVALELFHSNPGLFFEFNGTRQIPIFTGIIDVNTVEYDHTKYHAEELTNTELYHEIPSILDFFAQID